MWVPVFVFWCRFGSPSACSVQIFGLSFGFRSLVLCLGLSVFGSGFQTSVLVPVWVLGLQSRSWLGSQFSVSDFVPRSLGSPGSVVFGVPRLWGPPGLPSLGSPVFQVPLGPQSLGSEVFGMPLVPAFGVLGLWGPPGVSGLWGPLSPQFLGPLVPVFGVCSLWGPWVPSFWGAPSPTLWSPPSPLSLVSPVFGVLLGPQSLEFEGFGVP